MERTKENAVARVENPVQHDIPGDLAVIGCLWASGGERKRKDNQNTTAHFATLDKITIVVVTSLFGAGKAL